MNQLIILCGIPFAGKTVFAKTLEEFYDFKRVDLDEIKFEMFGENISDEEIDQPGWDAIYQKMYRTIRTLLTTGKNVVHDTGNFTIYERGLVNSIAKDLKIPFKTILIKTSADTALERLKANRESKERFDVSDKAFWEAVAEMEKPIKEENELVLEEDTQIDEWIEKNLVL